MKTCQLAVFPYLLNSSAAEDDYLGLEEHLREVTLLWKYQQQSCIY